MNELSCVVCGKKFWVKDGNPYKQVYCSEECRVKFTKNRIRKWRQARKVRCPYGEYQCEVAKCNACGWNPEVAQRRLEKFKEENGYG